LQYGKAVLNELREIYGAEKHQTVILPMLKKAASSLKLQNVLANHLDTPVNISPVLEKIFRMLGKKPAARQSEAYWGIGREAETVIESTERYRHA